MGEGQSYDFVVVNDVMNVEYQGVFTKVDEGLLEDGTMIDADSMFNGDTGQTGVIGIWYDSEGYAGTMQMYENGTCDMEVMGVTLSGTYTFDQNTGSGVITFDIMGEDDISDFYLEGEYMYLEGTEYTREYVEQMDMDEMMDGVEDIMDGIDF